ncbi:hypothetical protein L873DRAFT_1813783 [Choiromyces venosus 120613-1]|uniref:Uncharacterized protein n=1 Tax=Choiromyces venosus 120613-1 TaxID=1336337 RepID=A0A3N4J8Z5_9PEZI|nr:hypothetical protein L873DRAFT_1813783 [Choiromyces venosus 120613-1]
MLEYVSESTAHVVSVILFGDFGNLHYWYFVFSGITSVPDLRHSDSLIFFRAQHGAPSRGK